VAVLAGGISLYRLLVPIFMVAALMMGLKTINQELVISHPRVAPLLARDPGDAGDRELANFQVPLTADGRGQVWFASNFEPKTSVLSNVEIWRRDSRGVVTSRVSADEVRWKDGRGWEMTNPRVTSMEMGRAGSGNAPGGRSRVEAPTKIETDLEPSTLLFKRFASYRQCLSWVQIGEMLGSPHLKPELREELQRIRWGRLSTMISSLLALAITMPFFLMREPRNMAVQSLKCAPVGIVSLMGGTLLAAMPIPGLPAGFAVFLPVLVLLPIAVAVMSAVRT
jgi:lipopolysaccharide export LptBFGC system permease protein LptF